MMQESTLDDRKEERQARLLQAEENRARVQAEAERQAALRQQEAASILRAMNQRPASDRPRVVLANAAVAERPARQQHQAGKAAVGNRETPEEQRARLQSQALRMKIFRQDESEAERSARLRDQALRQKALRHEESEAEKLDRLREQSLRQKALRSEESEAEKSARLREQSLRQRCLRNQEIEAENAARLRDQLVRQENLRDIENEESNLSRLQDQSSRQENVRGRETTEERIERAISVRFRHQINLFDENEQESRVDHPEYMADYRATENEEEAAARREENRCRMELRRELEEQRERENEELRARDALDHGEIVPIENEEEEALRLQLMTERDRRGNPRTHRQACKEIVVEDRVHLHDCGDLTKICSECDAKHFAKEMPKDKKFQQCCAKGNVILPPAKPTIGQPLAKPASEIETFHEADSKLQQRPCFRLYGS
ncbi:LOW QUALITY PROTEIN: hypothetical protein DAPPUDRAFT_259660 [Daphnia pulex]|uniref:Uncharacterized protein n=1 Tax=Daphnia pulex TaxID=6669 RepID=E9HHL4_DAPPU|nr:LOW QUALITY PROTEIN: hypothetical protein DAPPUDRAFT_259660 [Daphnia pulex]|eukprot:EFX68722.1 LOW QUALITY PROTEIN: hypothetical protein DAPPUDRAFT_259660 [Daphnia pulex]